MFAVNGLSGYSPYIEGTVTAEGDNLVIWTKAAAELLLGRQDTGPLAPAAEHGELTDMSFLRTLLARVEAIWHSRAKAALRRGRFDNSIARWNKASSAALEMVSAHAALRAADAFIQAVQQAAEPGAQHVLRQLCMLFLLEKVSAHTGDLLAEAHLSAAHIRQLPLVTDSLLDDLAPHMRTLVDGFDLPEQFLNAIPMANTTGVNLADYA